VVLCSCSSYILTMAMDHCDRYCCASCVCSLPCNRILHRNQFCQTACAVITGGMAEYEAVSSFMAELDSRSWVSSETRLLNRSTAPRLLLSHRLAGRGAEQRWRPNVAFADAPHI
jgi:hypothetical protein